MKIFSKMRLVDKYRVEKSREPNDEGTHIVLHETESLCGFGFQKVFKGSYKECCLKKKQLEKRKKHGQLTIKSLRAWRYY